MTLLTFQLRLALSEQDHQNGAKVDSFTSFHRYRNRVLSRVLILTETETQEGVHVIIVTENHKSLFPVTLVFVSLKKRTPR